MVPPLPVTFEYGGHMDGAGAVRIGQLVADHPGRVDLRTLLGGRHIVDMLIGEQLPRIC